MTTTAHWEAARPPEPLGDLRELKDLIFAEDDRAPGTEAYVSCDDRLVTYLTGYRDGRPPGDIRDDLTRFLADLQAHGRLRIWIA